MAHLSSKAQEDFHLVQKAIHKDQQAFAQLMSRYRESLYYTIFKMVQNTEDAEDLTIESFSKAFGRLDSYTPQFAFSTWLFKIASNHCIDFLRKKRIKAISINQTGRGEDGDQFEIPVTDGELNPEQLMQRNQSVSHVRAVVDQLKPHYKKMIELRYFEEKSYEEIAEEMQLPLGTVKAQLFRAKDLLQELLGGAK
ncbi:MAG: sigma-70 family RNA polymerase sigma factor [Bacteroidetes bacterium]|nr:sigma-70 family RNA polymerase sigma factor [Bacteroidota bacterium]